MNLGGDEFKETSGTIRNCVRWSEIDTVRLPEIKLRVWIFNKILSIRVLEVVLILAGWAICGRIHLLVRPYHISNGQH